MKRRKLTAVIGIIAALALLFTACAETTAPETTPEPELAPVVNTYTASAKGYGGDVTATMTVTDDVITWIAFEGANETPGIGADALTRFNEILAGFEGRDVASATIDIDVVSGATVTSNAAKMALSQVLLEATGKAAVEAVLKDGDYTAEAWGFSLTTPLSVSVSIAGGRITKITPDVENSGETDQIIATAIDNMIPRILEEQSLAVDAVSGATSSSNAIKSAVRDCLKQSMAAAGMSEADIDIALSAFYREPAYLKKDAAPVDINTGVVVVGAGGTGCLAALEAANLGADTLVIETSAKYGGTSALTCGPMAVNSPKQVAANGGVDLVDEDLLLSTWLADARAEEGSVSAEIISYFSAFSGYNIDWMAEQGFEPFTLAIPFKYPQFCVWTMYPGWNAGRVHGAGLTHDYFNAIMQRYADLGGKTMFETTGLELLLDGGGNVMGVKAVGYDGQTYNIYADAVVIATGGYAGNEELLIKYTKSDEVGAYQTYGVTVNRGVSIAMGEQVDAKLADNIDIVMAHFSAPSKRIHMFDAVYNQVPTAFVVNEAVLDVNTNGERFINEVNASADAGDETARYYTIIGSHQLDSIKENGFIGTTRGMYMNPGALDPGTPLPEIDKVIDAGIELGFIFKADTIEGLAQAINKGVGAPMTKLKETVEAYNALCAAGADTQFGKPVEFLVPVEGEYFIAVEASPIIYSTCGGLTVDSAMRVVTNSGESLPNLFAAGTDTIGMLLYDEYTDYGGVAQSWAFCSGRMAGASAAMVSLQSQDITAQAKAATQADELAKAYADALFDKVKVERVAQDVYRVAGNAAYLPGLCAALGDDAARGVNYAAVLLDAPSGAAEGRVKGIQYAVGYGTWEKDDALTVKNGKALYLLQLDDAMNRHMGAVLTIDWGGSESKVTVYTDLLIMGKDASTGELVNARVVEGASLDDTLKKAACINVGLSVRLAGMSENERIYTLTGRLPELPVLTSLLKLDTAAGENYAAVLLEAPEGYNNGKASIKGVTSLDGRTELSVAHPKARAVTMADGTRGIMYVQRIDTGVILPMGGVCVNVEWTASGMEKKDMTYKLLFTELDYDTQIMDMTAALKAVNALQKGISIEATGANTWRVRGVGAEGAEVNVLLQAPSRTDAYMTLQIGDVVMENPGTQVLNTVTLKPGDKAEITAVWTTPPSFWSPPVSYTVTYTFVCE
ncbi:MAG: FAD-dependent oxidoreductase [Christensenellales bacterium]|jgi:uncharacterized protein with FMN-binding domain/succinate dehydrogenase/fumarate reductase flavoprotein subunit